MSQPGIVLPNSASYVAQLRSQQVWTVNSRQRNGLIIYKPFHAEFAGPGAAVGGVFDLDCVAAVPVGNLSLVLPDSAEERQNSFLIRRQWIRLIRKLTEQAIALQRAQMILNQFENYFDAEIVAELPDEAFGRLVGVFPQTVHLARRAAESFTMRTRF